MLRREMAKVEAGEDPLITIRGAAGNEQIDLPLEHGKDMFNDGFEPIFRRHMSRFSPIAEEILDVFRREKKPAPAAR
jgi:5,5'-dehydrodivanillate O-demethylase oxygenase subunit